MNMADIIPSSFRDPSGFAFYRDGALYRQVNAVYKEDYDHLMGSGLYKALVDAGLLIPHKEDDIGKAARPDIAYKVIRPEPVPFISYPYEWCFSAFKNAASLTLNIQKIAFDFGMALKDASAYNVQFLGGKPVFIDTLSFERYREGEPWVAYRQFCQHFLAPLVLMAFKDVRLGKLLSIYPDGIPLDLASSLLPMRTRFDFSVLSHIHIHSGYQRRFANGAGVKNADKMSKFSLIALIDNLNSAIEKLRWNIPRTEWSCYYEEEGYPEAAARHKKEIIAGFLDKISPKTVWDLGANTGLFSRVTGAKGIRTIAIDSDYSAVEKCYLECRRSGDAGILPLVIDITNPSPAIGWENRERMSIFERGPADLVMALALVHHLAIGNNLPLDRLAEFFSGICKELIIEFVPKNDPQAQRLLRTRKDIFPGYTQDSFKAEFSRYFTILDTVKITGSGRVMYLMRKAG